MQDSMKNITTNMNSKTWEKHATIKKSLKTSQTELKHVRTSSATNNGIKTSGIAATHINSRGRHNMKNSTFEQYRHQ